ncbi:MAG: hypothetical protein J6C19_08525 [Lachnospiraceae bacterium]|nr:hypothetical protein [Lachnospiraceae bacterium]
MAKKFGKLVLFSALAGAAAAGTYYFLQNKAGTPDDESDDFEDFDDFDEDLENEDFSSGTGNNAGSRNRPYVSLDIDNAKEIIGEKVIETLDKTKEKIEQFNVAEKIDKAKEFIGGMTTSASEPVYTQMDMSAAPASDTDTPASAPSSDDSTPASTADSAENDRAPENASVSVTYSDSAETKDTTEEFFNDSEQ